MRTEVDTVRDLPRQAFDAADLLHTAAVSHRHAGIAADRFAATFNVAGTRDIELL